MNLLDTNLNLEPEPLVSVAITSYNHAALLPKAIDSILQQQTNFPFEIVIGDDCSTDDTVAIARGYQTRYPYLIRIVARTKNVGTQRNYYDLFEQCRGKYIAWLDADDYWTDPQKLSLQAELLEKDASITICGHFVRWITRDGQVMRPRYPELAGGVYGTKAILEKNFMPSPSAMFRNGLQHKLPKWYFDVPPLTDWPLWVLGTCPGDIYMIDRVMADYTLNTTSSFWGKGDLFWREMNADFYDRVECELPHEFRQKIKERKGAEYEEIAYILRQQGKYAESRRAAWRAFQSPVIADRMISKAKALAASIFRELQFRVRGNPKLPEM